jgi:hypothetical protein
MNKRLRPWLALASLGLLALACTPARPHRAPALPPSPMMTCMKIAPFPVAPAQQDSAKTYFLDHEVLATATPDESERKALEAALVDPKNYVDGHARACEFLPGYGLRLTAAEVLLSAEPCPKLLLHRMEQDTVWDLADGNGVLPVVAKVLAGGVRFSR